MTDATGNTVWSTTYLPFGEAQRVLVDNVDNLYRFADMEYDSESGVYNTLFRKYAPNLGRWLGADPMGGSIDNPQSLNRYGYVVNNPTNFIDPLGLDFDPYNPALGSGMDPCRNPVYATTHAECRYPPPYRDCDWTDPFCGWWGPGHTGGGGGSPKPQADSMPGNALKVLPCIGTNDAELKAAIAGALNRLFNPRDPIQPDQLKQKSKPVGGAAVYTIDTEIVPQQDWEAFPASVLNKGMELESRIDDPNSQVPGAGKSVHVVYNTAPFKGGGRKIQRGAEVHRDIYNPTNANGSWNIGRAAVHGAVEVVGLSIFSVFRPGCAVKFF